MRVSDYMKDSKTAKMKDKEKLKKLVNIIKDLLRLEGNEWLVDELLEIIRETYPIEEIAKHSIIQNINEYCIEDKINKQANEFYSKFPLDEIKDQLVSDYKKMEHERRRDDFENFCLSMFQQVEAIVNYCFRTERIRTFLRRDRNALAFMKWDESKRIYVPKGDQRLIPFLLKKLNPERNKHSRNFNPSSQAPYYSLSEKKEVEYFDNDGYPSIEYDPEKQTWSISDRLRTILFYCYFNGEVFNSKEFENIFNVGEELRTIRNQNHRESDTPNYRKTKIELILDNKGMYYLKLYGFLHDFALKITQFWINEGNINQRDMHKQKYL